ncbi:hypothetical protein H2248_002102 [Termitomyces sp. 'cryptogamus']|nr:hypothetical protein H2248_002102 [Termitomyces sp. 'cryptogamus']
MHASGSRQGEKLLGVGVCFEGRPDLDKGAKWVCNDRVPIDNSPLLAILLASLRGGLGNPLEIATRSKVTIAALMKCFKANEDKGFIGVRNAGLLRTVIGCLRMHSSSIIFQDLSKSPLSMIEHKTVGIAEEAMNQNAVLILPPIPTELHITGARLLKVTQATAYKHIRNVAPACTRRRTTARIDEVKRVMITSSGKVPQDRAIWKGLRDKDFSRQTRVFLWKSAHDAYKVGTYWDKQNMAPELRERSECKHDGKLDSLDHIMSECSCPGQSQIWNLASEFWNKRTGKTFPSLNISSVIGLMLLAQQKEGEVSSEGLARLRKILIVESAYLIWVIRCERVISKDDMPFSPVKIENRWKEMVAKRAELDFKMTSARYGKWAAIRPLIQDTWKGTAFEQKAQEHGPRREAQGGVLVGIYPGERDGVG